MTSASLTSSSLAMRSAVGSTPACLSFSRCFRRLKNSLRWFCVDPPARVGRELDPAIGVELLDRLDQADVALLHEVEQVLIRALVLVGDLHHEPQVGGHQPSARLLVPVLDPPHRELVLLLAGQQRVAPHLGHVLAHRVAPGERRGGRRR
jgi:hypothetical protein